MATAIGNANGINLNTASPEELDRIGGLGRRRAAQIVQNRPIRSWDDLRTMEGFSGSLVDDLRQAGARL